jgi:Plavaka transposase
MYQINSKEKLSFYNSYSFLKKVDQLPIGPEWKCNIIEITGDQLDDDGNTMSEQVELWHRDPVECVKALVGNPAFKDFISYVPERVYTDDEGKVRVFDEMWTGNWWWETQVWLFLIVRRKTDFFL